MKPLKEKISITIDGDVLEKLRYEAEYDGRPLSQANKLADMYAKRQPLYAAFADHIIDNDGTLEETLAQFMEVCV